MAKINLDQTSPSHVLGSYTSQRYQKAVNQDMKILFVWSKKEAISKYCISKLD